MSGTPVVTQAGTHVRFFGPPRIERDGAPVAVDTRKAIALLAYLAFTGRTHSRDQLAALLWPDADQTRARSALRRTLSTLNSALGGRGLRIERESLALVAGEVDVDVVRFREAIRTGDHRTAVDLAPGEFLSGFVLRDSAEFDDWQLQASDDLRRELGDVFDRLSSAALDDDPDAALAFALRWVELDELHEPAHRAVMRAYARKGDRSSALRQYRTCVAALERGLGVEPLDETNELYESIREGRASVPSAPTPQPRTVTTTDLPFVGRDGELAQLRRAYASIGPDGHLVVIGGEPGIGKTRLVHEFLDTVREHSSVIEVKSHPEEQLMAFGTILEVLRAIPVERLGRVARDALVDASRIHRPLAPDATIETVPDSPDARRRLISSVADVITTAAGDVVFIDDAHCMDASSVEIFRFVVRRLRGHPMCIVMTWRTEEVPPAHPLRRMLADAGRDGLATGVTLERLTRDDVDRLAELTDTPDDVAATLFAETAGVPFFVAEYIKSPEPMPGGVRDLLASRIDGVAGSAAQVLGAAAVVGRAFEPRTLREASGRSEDEVVQGLDDLVAHGLVADVGEQYDFTHPKLREYVYEQTSLGRRRLLHGRIGKATARAARRRPELHAIAAQHYERAGDEDAAAEHFRAAGNHAHGVYANAEALAHYRAALALGEADPELHELIGDLLTLDGRYGAAIASFEKAAALGADAGTIARKLGNVRHRLGEWDSAEAHLLEAEQSLPSGRDRARVLAERALNAHRAGRTDGARDLAERASAEAAATGDEVAIAQAHNVAGILASHRGDRDAARAQLTAGLEIAERLGDLAAEAAAHNNLAVALRLEGAGELALASAQRALEICVRIGDRHREAAVHSNIADVLHDLGRPDEAIEHLKRSAAIFADVGEAGTPQPEIWKLVEW